MVNHPNRRRSIPKRVHRAWDDLTAEQRQHILDRSLPGWHPSNLPKTEDEARRTRWLVREDSPASLDIGAEVAGMTISGEVRGY
jgi:hypothetical protein